MKRLLNNLLALTIISTTLGTETTINSVINNIEQQQNNDDIITNYDYYYGKVGDGSWSYTLNFNDEQILSIVDFTKFSSSWDSFIKKYPYILISTYGEVNSPETFGNVGEGRFGIIKIYLNNVENINDRIYWRTLVNSNSYWFMSYDVSCHIKLGLFITDNKELKLSISVKSYLYSAGAYNRHLTTVLGVTSAKLVFAPLV